MKNRMEKLVLDTENCKILKSTDGHIVLMKMKDGQWLENAPHTPDLRGLVAALTLALDVLTGKVWPNAIRDRDPTPAHLEQKKLISGGDS